MDTKKLKNIEFLENEMTALIKNAQAEIEVKKLQLEKLMTAVQTKEQEIHGIKDAKYYFGNEQLILGQGHDGKYLFFNLLVTGYTLDELFTYMKNLANRVGVEFRIEPLEAK